MIQIQLLTLLEFQVSFYKQRVKKEVRPDISQVALTLLFQEEVYVIQNIKNNHMIIHCTIKMTKLVIQSQKLEKSLAQRLSTVLRELKPSSLSEEDYCLVNTFQFTGWVGNVLVSQAAITKNHRLGGLKNKHFFFMIQEARNPRLRCQQVWVFF